MIQKKSESDPKSNLRIGGDADMTARREGGALPARLDPERFPVIGPGQTYATITDRISAIVQERKTGKGWIIGFTISFCCGWCCCSRSRSF